MADWIDDITPHNPVRSPEFLHLCMVLFNLYFQTASYLMKQQCLAGLVIKNGWSYGLG